jgi:hypothetical protein
MLFGLGISFFVDFTLAQSPGTITVFAAGATWADSAND